MGSVSVVDMNSPAISAVDATQIVEERPVPCQFICGKAGVGKTFEMLRRTQADHQYGMLTATTGIAAVNLNSITLNSAIKYFDTASMRDAFLTGNLTRSLHKIAKQYHSLIIDEASMLDATQLDLLVRGVGEANRYKDAPWPLEIILVGDFGQLPPVNARWCFDAESWPLFAANTTRLTKVWRQGTGPFLDALNHARMGEGGACAELLTQAGATWHTSRVVEFDGTTILSKNDQVSRHNAEMLRSLPGESFFISSRRWGQQRPEWGQNSRTHEWGIPPQVELKIGCYIMVLANTPKFEMVNGDCAHVVSYDPDADTLIIKLVRNDREMAVNRVVRSVEQSDKPTGDVEHIAGDEDSGGYLPHCHYRARTHKYVMGQVERFPIRLAYASTVHKVQGLSLDRVQADVRERFYSMPSMVYVSLSRARTLEGLRMVCGKDYFVRQVHMDRRVLPWL